MIWVIAYVGGFILTTLTLGILYHRGTIAWSPSGEENGCEAPPHLLAGMFWPVFVSIMSIAWAIIFMYRGFNFVSEYLATIKIKWRNDK